MNIDRAHMVVLFLLTLTMTALPVRGCNAEDPAMGPLSLVAIGIRYGTNSGTHTRGDLDRIDAFGSWRTPYAWEFSPGWDVGARLNASVGAIRGQGETGAVGTLVPTLAIGDTGNVFSFELGVGAALFSKWDSSRRPSLRLNSNCSIRLRQNS